MPPTRTAPRAKSKAAASSSRSAYDDVIVISSDEEDMSVSNTSIALKEARHKIRALKKKLANKASERNHSAEPATSPSHATKPDERHRLEYHLYRAGTDLKKWKSKFSARHVEVMELKNRIKVVEKELDNLKVKNKKMREDIQKRAGRNNHNVLTGLKDHTICDICSHRLWRPFLLPCGHTYCQECLVTWFDLAVAAGSHLKCPSCREVLNRAPVQNYALKSIVEAICSATNSRGGSPPPQNPVPISWNGYFH